MAASRARASADRLVSWVDSVVSRCGQRAWASAAGRVPLGRTDRVERGVAAHLAAVGEREPAVQRRVLLALGRHRPGELLEPGHDQGLGLAHEVTGQDRREEVEEFGIEVGRRLRDRGGQGGGDHGAIDLVDLRRAVAVGDHVGAVARRVDGQLHDGGLQRRTGVVPMSSSAGAHRLQCIDDPIEVGGEAAAEHVAPRRRVPARGSRGAPRPARPSRAWSTRAPRGSVSHRPRRSATS